MSNINFMSNSYSEINYNGDKDVQSTQIVIKDDLGKIYMRENEKETERDMTPDEINAVLKGNPLKLTKNTTKKGAFILGAAQFNIDEDYDNQSLLVVYINGLLAEEGVDYTRDGIIIKKEKVIKTFGDI